MGLIKDWNSWGKHPHSVYGEIVDFDGIRKGSKKCNFRGVSSGEEKEEAGKRQASHHQQHLEQLRKKKEDRAELQAGLRFVKALCCAASWVMNPGITKQELGAHHFPVIAEPVYFAQRGTMTSSDDAAGFVLRRKQ